NKIEYIRFKFQKKQRKRKSSRCVRFTIQIRQRKRNSRRCVRFTVKIRRRKRNPRNCVRFNNKTRRKHKSHLSVLFLPIPKWPIFRGSAEFERNVLFLLKSVFISLILCQLFSTDKY